MHGESISEKNTVYTDKIILDESEKEELNRRLTILHALTVNGRAARQNRVRVDVTCYEPCTDRENAAWGFRGRYRTVSGICERVDRASGHTLCIDGRDIAFEDILRIESPAGIFDTEEGGTTDVHAILY